ncbi:MAG: DinB family protein [Candidatus Delongbacteria bacterium]|nr:DinB family protein [Candidatus Delongbacteria bacterium]MBN2834859.1 DinB family protein [Candidatus Delongbacteria bacterium]
MELKSWNEKLQYLRKIINNPEEIEEVKKVIFELHNMVHVSEMAASKIKTFEDELWENLDEDTIRNGINEKGRTIAYGIWHSSRIEDITMNILVDESQQIFEEGNWKDKIKSPIKNTGNALTEEEIKKFSQQINIIALREYRIAVGRKTREIIKHLKTEDFKKKMKVANLQRVLDEEAVENIEKANWLIEFWGKKNEAGLLFMPVTRHNVVHINESLKAKKNYQRVKTSANSR